VVAGTENDDLARALAGLLAAVPMAPGPSAEGAQGATAPVPLRAVAVEASAELQPGGGLGCSAALGVAIGRAVEDLAAAGHATAVADARALARAAAWEQVFHGNPSGIDTAAALHGGCLRFSRAEGVRPVEPAVDLWLCIGSSGPGASTKTMVEGVAALRGRKPHVVDGAVEAVRSLVDNAALAVEAGDLAALGRFMDLNQMLLAGLMVSTEAIEHLCQLARGAGALGAKLTGAGGGGSVVALVPSSRLGAEALAEADAERSGRAILDAWAGAGFSGFLTRVRSRARVISVHGARATRPEGSS
jgi:mevalonate kinase